VREGGRGGGGRVCDGAHAAVCVRDRVAREQQRDAAAAQVDNAAGRGPESRQGGEWRAALHFGPLRV